MADRPFHAKMRWRTGCCIGVAVQVVTRARSDLSKSIELGSFQAANSSCFLYKRKMAMLQLLKAYGNGFSPLSQRKSFVAVEDSVSSEGEAYKAGWDHSGTADHAIRRLTLELSKSLHDLLENIMLYALENNKLFEWSTMQQ